MGGQADLREAIAHYERAIQLQGDYAPAYAGFSLALQNGADAATKAEAARSAALKAIDLEPDLSESHVALASLHGAEWNWSEADAAFRRALELNPNSLDACGCYANLLTVLGRFPEAIALTDRMIATNPLAPFGHFQRGVALYYAQRFDEAVPSLQRVLELEPENAQAKIVLARTYVGAGRLQDALAVVEETMFANSWLRAFTYARAGKRAEAIKIVEGLSRSPRPDRRGIGLVYVALGENDRGLEWFTKSIEAHEALAPAIKFEPLLASLRSDSRFPSLVAHLKMPASQP
jgi:tetratricopeptide (TPR) repeat protein